MNLVDDTITGGTNNKKVILIAVITIAVILVLILGLLAVAMGMNKNVTLVVDGKNVTKSNYLIKENDEYYIGIKDFVNLTNNNYNYKNGNKDMEDENKCYITNTYESTFFEVGSNKIYKVLEDTQDVEYYELDKPIIKKENDIYMPISAIKTAGNAEFKQEKNKIEVNSIGYIESLFNVDTDKNKKFVKDESIVWDTTYSNKKLLKDRLVVIKDDTEKLGVGLVSSTYDKKTKKTTVSTKQVITPKYTSVQYVEKYKSLIVETEAGKGIVQLVVDENGQFKVKTKIDPQYEEIKLINEKLYLIAENMEVEEEEETSTSDKTKVIKKYGIIDENGNTILPTEYNQIGINLVDYTNNGIDNGYIINEKYIPVCKNKAWGLVDLSGKEVLKLSYEAIGCNETNSTSNVLVIPELNGIVVKKDKLYGMVNYKGETIVGNIASRIYIDSTNDKRVYTMIYNNSRHDIVEYVNNKKKKETPANNTTNNTTSNATNSTANKASNNTTKTTNQTNATNTTNATKTTNGTANKTNNPTQSGTVVINKAR